MSIELGNSQWIGGILKNSKNPNVSKRKVFGALQLKTDQKVEA